MAVGRGHLVLASAAALLLLVGRPVEAQYLSAYKDGLDAVEAKDWERAAGAMSRAVGMRSEEKAKLPVRLFLRPYLPHFYLGYARFERGDCAGALAAWAESERQGIAPRLPEFAAATSGRKTCEERAGERALTEARRDARQSLARSTLAADALLARARDPQVGPGIEGDPSAAERHQQSLDLLAQARRLLGDATLDATGLSRAETLLRRADDVLGSLAVDLDRLDEARRQALEAKGRGIETRVAEAEAALERTTFLAPYPREVRRARADLEALIAEAARRDTASPPHLDGLAARLESSTATLAKVAAAPPDALAKAATAYLEGRHRDVVDGLSGARLGERRARAHAHLLLAASRFALYLEHGELDDELRAEAVADARACREEDETIAPSARYFSPRFVAFFNESKAAPSTPSG